MLRKAASARKETETEAAFQITAPSGALLRMLWAFVIVYNLPAFVIALWLSYGRNSSVIMSASSIKTGRVNQN